MWQDSVFAVAKPHEKTRAAAGVVPKFSEDGLEGFMPRNRRFGFVKTSQMDARTVAHEIGHGAFNLRHTFPEAPQSSTDNLMDYTQDKYALLKAQWDLIHNPENTTGLWDDMEDGAMINPLDLLDDIRTANSKEQSSLTITKDKCPQGYYPKVVLGENTLSFLQLTCNSDFEKMAIDSTITNHWYEWKPKFGSKVVVKPKEKAQVFVESINRGKIVYYQFHELKVEPAPQEVLTNNLMFEFAVLEKEKLAFEDYLYPKPLIKVENMSYLSQMDSTSTANLTGCNQGCCQAASVWMVEQKGVSVNHSDRIYFEDAINTLDLTDGITPTLSEKEFNNAITYIKNSLKAQKPILFGTWDSREAKNYPNDDPKAYNDMPPGKDNSPTTHFMVIMEYGYDKNQGKYYFRFYDPGRNEKTDDGISEQNRLYIDESTKEVISTTYRGKTYKLTEIRKNY